MSLNQKYTWAQFLREHSEHKKTKLKRTSKEGIKAFEAAFKKHCSDYLNARTETIAKQKQRAENEHSEITKKVQALTKAKKWPQVKIYQAKVGKKTAWLARLTKQAERVKTLQKHK